MKKLINITILLLVSSSLHGQSFTENELTGKWKAVKIMGDVSDMPSEYTSFLHATFVFKKNKKFHFNSKVEELNRVMKNCQCRWKLNLDKSEIIVQKWKDKDSNKKQLMNIKIYKRDKKIYFLLEATLFLEMKKIY